MGIAGAIVGAGAIGGVASLGGGLIQSGAAQSAANTQLQASQSAETEQMLMYNQNAQKLQPFVGQGYGAGAALEGLTGSGSGGNPLTAPLTAPFQPTMAQLAATPGYQFTLGQGLLATQNSFASQGLGSSGAAAKGAAQYAEGLASTTYQQQFQNYLTQNQQIYSMLSNQENLGESAATGSAQLGAQAASNVGTLGTAGAAASAAGQVGSASALSNALGGVSGAGSNTALMLALNNSGLFGSNANTITNSSLGNTLNGLTDENLQSAGILG